jgi:hypothetical protein
MIVKNRNSIVLSKKNNQRSTVVNNARRRINNATTTTTTTTPPPIPEDSDVFCLNLAPGLYKKKYEGYFYDNDDFFNSKLVGQISFADIGKTYRITDAGTATDQDWYSWGFFPQTEYDTPEALGLPFPSIGKGVFYDGFGSINNAGTASVSPILVSEEVTSQIDDNYSQAQGQNNKSLIIKGYFKPTVNGVYKFRLYSDDASYLWFGNDALDGNRTTSNAVVSLPGIHGPYHTDPPGTFTMVANSYYPLTVEFGNGPDGEGVLIFDYMPPGSDTWTSDLAGKLFYDIDSKGHRVCPPPNIDNMFFPSLWLDASTGVNKFDYNYISRIVLSGNPSVSGTYNASSIPSYNFEYQKLNNYSLGAISYDGDTFNVIEAQLNNIYSIGFNSYDGQNWNVSRTAYSRPTINGLTNGYEEANGTYDYNDDAELDQLSFGIRGNGIAYQIQYSNINNAHLNAYNLDTDEITLIATLTNGVWSMAIEGIGTATGGIITSLSGPVPNGTITTSNVTTDYVTSWNDQSNNENNATAYNGPELITNELNGKSVISFNGSSSYLEAAISLLQNQDRTIFIVGKYNDINADQQGFLNLLGDGAESYVFKQAELDESYYYIHPAQIAAPTSVSVGNYHIVSISNNTEPNTSTMRINGVAGNNDYGEMTTKYASYANIGSRNADGEFLNGSIAEVIIYNRALTTSERQEVENYLSNKYAISLA